MSHGHQTNDLNPPKKSKLMSLLYYNKHPVSKEDTHMTSFYKVYIARLQMMWSKTFTAKEDTHMTEFL